MRAMRCKAMDAEVITAAIVDQADRLLAFKIDHATIAARLGITECVVGVIAGDPHRNGRRQPPELYARHVRHRPNAVDVSVVRMVQRPAVSTARPVLKAGEQFVPKSSPSGGGG